MGWRWAAWAAIAAQVVATNAYGIAEVADQTLRRVDAVLGPAMTGSETKLLPVLEGLPSVTELYVVDAAANTIYATVPGAENVSVADCSRSRPTGTLNLPAVTANQGCTRAVANASRMIERPPAKSGVKRKS